MPYRPNQAIHLPKALLAFPPPLITGVPKTKLLPVIRRRPRRSYAVVRTRALVIRPFLPGLDVLAKPTVKRPKQPRVRRTYCTATGPLPPFTLTMSNSTRIYPPQA
jgi:hypothetical protein